MSVRIRFRQRITKNKNIFWPSARIGLLPISEEKSFFYFVAIINFPKNRFNVFSPPSLIRFWFFSDLALTARGQPWSLDKVEPHTVREKIFLMAVNLLHRYSNESEWSWIRHLWWYQIEINPFVSSTQHGKPHPARTPWGLTDWELKVFIKNSAL